MPAVPRIAHFVHGLRPQTEPFHLVHHLAIESCRRVLRPDTILFHHHHLPYGELWDLVRPHLTLVRVDPVDLVTRTHDERVPDEYRYAHHADFIRLDALVEHGGVYADLDTLFLRPLPGDLFDAPFVIGEEDDVPDGRTGAPRPSLCNAVLLAEPGSAFARRWRDAMPAAFDGSWSNHSGFLSRALADAHPDEVRVLPRQAFFPAPFTPDGIRDLLERDATDTSASYTVHLWAHLWWARDRRDFSAVHAGLLTIDHVRGAATTYARLARPFLPELDLW